MHCKCFFIVLFCINTSSFHVRYSLANYNCICCCICINNDYFLPSCRDDNSEFIYMARIKYPQASKKLVDYVTVLLLIVSNESLLLSLVWFPADFHCFLIVLCCTFDYLKMLLKLPFHMQHGCTTYFVNYYCTLKFNIFVYIIVLTLWCRSIRVKQTLKKM